ncbi:DoxX family membrane protein [Belliella sp. DSM 107340]|uniref:DoxX family membrane protein n=1 Tax=Belliella calami TaxID=2923436 RepID=A0ABS9UTU5_9BACT|nr:DoxX family membrane protein [Belliella calami]MCH7400041.1 DoxX family membrane protein [Belliella calami]
MNKNYVVSGISVLVLRICLSGIFITAGTHHLVSPANVVERIQSAPFGEFASLFGNSYFLALSSGYGLILGGLGLLLGIFNRWSATLLFLILIPITITIQTGSGIGHGPLWKNIALFGGLLFFMINNPKVYSVYTK